MDVLPRLSLGAVAAVKVLIFPRPTHARTVLPEVCVVIGLVESVPAGAPKCVNASVCAPTVGDAVAAVTVKVVLLVKLPTIAVIVVLPTPTAEARPLDVIVAMPVFEELQLTPLVST